METVGPILAPGHKQTPFFESSLRSQYFLGGVRNETRKVPSVAF